MFLISCGFDEQQYLQAIKIVPKNQKKKKKLGEKLRRKHQNRGANYKNNDDRKESCRKTD